MSFQQSVFPTTNSVFKPSYEPARLPLWMPSRIISEHDIASNLYGEPITEQTPTNMKQFKFIDQRNDLGAMRNYYADKIFQSRASNVERFKYLTDSMQPNLHTIYPNVTFFRK